MRFSPLLVESADPPVACVVGAMASERVMNLVHQPERELPLAEAEEVADGERVGPQIALRRAIGGQARALREALHQLARLRTPRGLVHGGP